MSAARVFDAAARHQNFTRAAEELGITQSAVSHQIRLLEKRLGVPLFRRVGGGVGLTAAGQRIAAALIAAFDAMEGAFGALASEDARRLSISAHPTFGAIWLAPRLGAFQMMHQELAVRLGSDSGMPDFSTGLNDAAIRMGRGGWSGLSQDFLFRRHFAPMCSPAFAAAHALARPGQLAEVARFSPAAPWWNEWLGGTGIKVPQPGAEAGLDLDNQVLEARAAMAGAGVAMLSPLLWCTELAAGRLVQPFDYVHVAAEGHWLAYPEARRSQAKIVAFRDWILGEVAEAAADLPQLLR